MKGIIKTLYVDKGFFFIKGENGVEYFAHRSTCKNCKIDELSVGQEVEFEDAEGTKGPRAEDVFV